MITAGFYNLLLIQRTFFIRNQYAQVYLFCSSKFWKWKLRDIFYAKRKTKHSSVPSPPTLTISFPLFSPPIYCDVNNNNNGARVGSSEARARHLICRPPSALTILLYTMKWNYAKHATWISVSPRNKGKGFFFISPFFFPSQLSAPALSTGVHNIPSFQVLGLLHSYEAVWRYRLRVYFPTPGVHFIVLCSVHYGHIQAGRWESK